MNITHLDSPEHYYIQFTHTLTPTDTYFKAVVVSVSIMLHNSPTYNQVLIAWNGGRKPNIYSTRNLLSYVCFDVFFQSFLSVWVLIPVLLPGPCWWAEGSDQQLPVVFHSSESWRLRMRLAWKEHRGKTETRQARIRAAWSLWRQSEGPSVLIKVKSIVLSGRNEFNDTGYVSILLCLCEFGHIE